MTAKKRSFRGRMRTEEEIEMLTRLREMAFASSRKQAELKITPREVAEAQRLARELELHGGRGHFG